MSSKNFFESPKGEKSHHKYTTSIEKKLASSLSSFNEFITDQITTSVILALFALIAIILASIPSTQSGYFMFTDLDLGFTVDKFKINFTTKQLVNDFLMSLFFFLLGLEVKREIIGGKLSHSKVRNTVLFSAIGGILAPATIYILLTPDKYELQGWAVPVATDTAFALGILALLKRKLPQSIFAFVAALAVMDDLGAIGILALFYSEPLVPSYILAAAFTLALLVLFNMMGIRKFWPYLTFGAIVWFFVEQAGLHGTLAGVLVAFTIPTRPKYGPKKFITKIDELTTKLATEEQLHHTTLIEDEKKLEIIEKVEELAVTTSSPVARLQRLIGPSIFLLVLPIFALINTGIPVSINKFLEAFSHPLTFHIFISLLLGKFIGVTFGSILAIKLKLGRLPNKMAIKHIIGVGLLAGIGFTMSIFIAEIGFEDLQVIYNVKTGIFTASIIAAILTLGYFSLFDLRKS